MNFEYPKILEYDVETTPLKSWTWGTYNINVIKVIEPSRIISIAWKWLGQKRIYCKALPDYKSYKRNPKCNKQLLKEFNSVIDSADIAIAHNIVKFDDRKVNTGIIKNKLEVPSPHKIIDTLQVARSRFAFHSNRLDDLGEYLGIGRKVKHPGFSMWEGCMDGDPASWELMKKYNKGDITLLEGVYFALRPWVKNHPNLTLYTRKPGCPRCLSEKWTWIGYEYLTVSKHNMYKCDDCSGSFTMHYVNREIRVKVK